MRLACVTDGKPAEVTIQRLIIAGWTGRDPHAVQAHVEELAALGVPRPASTPVFYRAAAQLLNMDETIQVLGTHSTGEVEAVLLSHAEQLWVGVGSDHTDRSLEATSVAAAKQACAKPLGPQFWAYETVEDHWDRLIIRSFLCNGSHRELYQEGALASNLTPRDLLLRYGSSAALASGSVMFCGTVPIHGELRSTEGFEVELFDPVRARALRHHYRIVELPQMS